MIARSEWRERADDPKTPIGWIIGIDRWHGIPIYSVVATLVALSVVARDVLERLLSLGFGELIATFLPNFVLIVSLIAIAPKPRSVSAPDPAPGLTHQGRVSLAIGERSLGEDAGIVAFNEGWLLFEGERTSFSLSPSDVRHIYRTGETRVDLESGHRLRFYGSPDLQDDVRRWLQEPPATGLSRLPPIDPHPQRRLRTASLLSLGSAGLLGGSTAIAATTLPRSAYPLQMTVLLLAALALSGLFAWRSNAIARRLVP